MKKEDMFDILSDIDEKSVEEAQDFHVRKKPLWKDWGIYGALAAMIVVAVLVMPLFGSKNRNAGVKQVLAAGPEELKLGDEGLRKWAEDLDAKLCEARPLSRGTASYSAAIMKEILTAEDENTVCSPLNTYLAFAMLAETSDGNTRKQILDMLGAEDIETVRKTANVLWEANSANHPVLKCLLANSIWLNDQISFREPTLKALADQYHASSFRGTAGSDRMNKALQDWTNDATGGLLKDYVKDLKTSPDTVMMLLSTLYFKDEWKVPFLESATDSGVFHGTKGDTAVKMMHQRIDELLETDRFSAVRLSLTVGGMVFCLPSENTDVNALLSDPALLQLTDENVWSSTPADLSLPRFKVSAKTDLLPVLEALDVTDVLDPAKADFSPLTEDRMALFLGEAEHAATVEIDENGVTGAAYTELHAFKGIDIREPVPVVFDRPFLFMVTGADGSILFAGIVRNITE